MFQLYINASGLMWEHGREMGALLVWAEHRFEGTSYPNLTGVPDCAAAGTSAQALADYIALIKVLQHDYGGGGGKPDVPVIAFGGSYGGMLAAWIRVRYPDVITGAIAASAPVITRNTTTKDVLQGGFYAISRGMKSKADTPSVGVAGAHCFGNYLAAQVLLPILEFNEFAQAEMAKGVRTCPGHTPPKTISAQKKPGATHTPRATVPITSRRGIQKPRFLSKPPSAIRPRNSMEAILERWRKSGTSLAL